MSFVTKKQELIQVSNSIFDLVIFYKNVKKRSMCMLLCMYYILKDLCILIYIFM